MRRITIAISLTISLSLALCELGQPKMANAMDAIEIELRSGTAHVRLKDEILISVFFRAPRRPVTLWNAFGWSSSTGLYLQVTDSSQHEVKRFTQMFDILPPDETGRGELISIGGESFAGFDSHIPANVLFPEPGKFFLKCIYSPPLPRNYFQGTAIWGKEDGQIESSEIAILVEK